MEFDCIGSLLTIRTLSHWKIIVFQLLYAVLNSKCYKYNSANQRGFENAVVPGRGCRWGTPPRYPVLLSVFLVFLSPCIYRELFGTLWNDAYLNSYGPCYYVTLPSTFFCESFCPVISEEFAILALHKFKINGEGGFLACLGNLVKKTYLECFRKLLAP